jgi:protein-S-isoprenylcysteine O-methyltransferase Ste14
MNSQLPDESVTAPESGIGTFLVSHRKAWEYLCNAALCLSAVIFNYVMWFDFLQKHRVSSLYVALFEAGVVYFSVCRPMPKESNRSLYDWTIALMGSYLIMLMRPAPQVHDHLPFLITQVIGMAISLTGLFSLNKSFGLVAANRGVKTGGLYGVMRHPIYAGYFLSFGSFLIQNITLTNVVIYGVFVTLELMRIGAEERVLSQDPDYAGYARKTRWRVLPFVY